MHRSIQLNLNPFTLDRRHYQKWFADCAIAFPVCDQIKTGILYCRYANKIIQRSARILGTKISTEAIQEIGGRSRGTPRIANGLLRRVRDFAQVLNDGEIDLGITQHALKALNVDEYGLDDMDNKILFTIIEKFKGGPVGITTIATAVGEEAGTIEEVYEPFLIQEGFLATYTRGREVTAKAYEHLGKKPGNSSMVGKLIF